MASLKGLLRVLRASDSTSENTRETLLWLYRVAGKKRHYVVFITLIQALTSSVGVWYALLMRDIVDSAVAKNAVAFRRYVIMILCLVIAQIALSAVIRWLNELARSDLENALKQRIVDGILRKDYASVSSLHSADWLNRITGDTSAVANGCIGIIPSMVATVVRLVSALVMIVMLDWWFAVILVPGGLLLAVLTFMFRKVLKELYKNIRESDGRLRVYLQEHIGNLMMIKSFAAEDATSRGAAEKMADHKAARMRRNAFSNFCSVGYSFAMQGMYFAGVIYCAYGIMNGRVTYGTLTAVMQLIGQVQGPLSGISSFVPWYYSVIASAERLMVVEGYADDGEVAPASEVRALYDGSLHCLGLRDASFSYQPIGEEEMPVVLSNLSLQIRKGEYVAFTGHSGCGKSTVLKLLMCLYPLDGGERFVDDAPLTAYHRRLFAYVPQGNALVSGSIREVVSFADPEAAHDDERIREALAIACADEFVDDIDTVLGERGSGLSEGQMQRIAIARAIFSDAPILLLDESTSALDELTERHLLENLRSLTDRTVVIVTHRSAALTVCDRVLRFAADGVEEVGSDTPV